MNIVVDENKPLKSTPQTSQQNVGAQAILNHPAAEKVRDEVEYLDITKKRLAEAFKLKNQKS